MEENNKVWNADNYSQIYEVSTQDVKVCFLQFTVDTLIELVEPGVNNKPLSKLLSKGSGYYHIGFTSHAYDESVGKLMSSHCRQLSEFHSEAFNGKRCSFFYHPQLRLIELIEA
jgi:hypothetical protein